MHRYLDRGRTTLTLTVALLCGATLLVASPAAAWPVLGGLPNATPPGRTSAAAPAPSFGTVAPTDAPPAPSDAPAIPEAPAAICPPCPCVAAPGASPQTNAAHYPNAPAPYPSPDHIPPAPPPPPIGPPSGEHEHDGFYLRMFFGGAGTRFTSNTPVGSRIGGAGASFGLALGGHIAGGLILFGELDIAGPGAPITVHGALPFSVSEAELVGLGMGAAYYIMPLNLYLSATALFTTISVTTLANTDIETNTGPGLSFMLGKEWWVSPNWGLGIAGQGWVARMNGGDLGPERWNAAVWSLVLSGTYN